MPFSRRGKKRGKWERKPFLETCYQLQIEQPGCEAVGDGISGIGEILNQEIGNGIGPVDDVEYFEGGPDVFKVFEGAMTAAFGFIAVEQQGAEAQVDADIGVDKQGVAVFYAAGNI